MCRRYRLLILTELQNENVRRLLLRVWDEAFVTFVTVSKVSSSMCLSAGMIAVRIGNVLSDEPGLEWFSLMFGANPRLVCLRKLFVQIQNLR